jgi:hypothetical protein
VIGNAVEVAKIATGEVREGTRGPEEKDEAAASLRRRAASGGVARAKSMTEIRPLLLARAHKVME